MIDRLWPTDLGTQHWSICRRCLSDLVCAWAKSCLAPHAPRGPSPHAQREDHEEHDEADNKEHGEDHDQDGVVLVRDWCSGRGIHKFGRTIKSYVCIPCNGHGLNPTFLPGDEVELVHLFNQGQLIELGVIKADK